MGQSQGGIPGIAGRPPAAAPGTKAGSAGCCRCQRPNHALPVWFKASGRRGSNDMNNIFYVIGVVVVVLFILGYFGLHA